MCPGRYGEAVRFRERVRVPPSWWVLDAALRGDPRRRLRLLPRAVGSPWPSACPRSCSSGWASWPPRTSSRSTRPSIRVGRAVIGRDWVGAVVPLDVAATRTRSERRRRRPGPPRAAPLGLDHRGARRSTTRPTPCRTGSSPPADPVRSPRRWAGSRPRRRKPRGPDAVADDPGAGRASRSRCVRLDAGPARPRLRPPRRRRRRPAQRRGPRARPGGAASGPDRRRARAARGLRRLRAPALRASRTGTALTVVNAPGTVDAGYRGEVCVNLLNTDPPAAGHDRARRPDRPARGAAGRTRGSW